MPTILEKPLIRETGLKRDGNDVYVVMLPSDDGGVLAFKEKGKHGKGVEMALSKVMSDALGTPQAIEKPVVAKKVATEDEEHAVDLIDLGTLESRIMIEGEGMMSTEVKARLWTIIREIREERREEIGMPNLVRMSNRKGKTFVTEERK
jgi:hypothetical protein